MIASKYLLLYLCRYARYSDGTLAIVSTLCSDVFTSPNTDQFGGPGRSVVRCVCVCLCVCGQ